MTLLLEVWLPNRLPPLSMSFLFSLLLSLLPTHSMLVSPLMAWDMLAFPTLALDWVTTVLASPTLDSLWFLLLLLLRRNEHFFLFSLLFLFPIKFILSFLKNQNSTDCQSEHCNK